MSAATPTTHEAILKTIYPQSDIERMMYDGNTLYAMLPKKYDFYGNQMHRALRIASTAGRSSTFLNAKNNKKASTMKKLLIDTVEDYSLYSVDGKLVRQTSNSKGALIKALTEEVDSAMDAMNRSFGFGVYLNKGGAIGNLTSSATLTATSFTLNDINDVVKFEVGQKLQFSATDGTSGSVKAGNVEVTGVARETGVITVTPALSTGVPTIAVSDYIFFDGDFGERMSGLAGWIPSTAPTAGDSFFGLDRSTDPSRMAGVRVDGTTRQIEEALKLALQVGLRNGCRVDKIFMNDRDFLNFDLALGSNKKYVEGTVAKVGFTGIQLVGYGSKPVEVYSDFNCPINVVYGLTMNTWSVEGPGQFPFIDVEDKLQMLREESADAYAGQIKSYHQMICTSPGRSWRCALV